VRFRGDCAIYLKITITIAAEKQLQNENQTKIHKLKLVEEGFELCYRFELEYETDFEGLGFD